MDNSNSVSLARELRELLQAALSHLRARLELAGLEGKDAFTRICGVLLLAVLAITLVLAGYFLLCLALVFGIARLLATEHAWIWIATLVGSMHLIAAWGILCGALGWLRKPMFASTIEEFRKDESWLKSTAVRQR